MICPLWSVCKVIVALFCCLLYTSAEGYNQVVGIIAMNFLEANLILFYLLVFGLETDVVPVSYTHLTA